MRLILVRVLMGIAVMVPVHGWHNGQWYACPFNAHHCAHPGPIRGK